MKAIKRKNAWNNQDIKDAYVKFISETMVSEELGADVNKKLHESLPDACIGQGYINEFQKGGMKNYELLCTECGETYSTKNEKDFNETRVNGFWAETFYQNKNQGFQSRVCYDGYIAECPHCHKHILTRRVKASHEYFTSKPFSILVWTDGIRALFVRAILKYTYEANNEQAFFEKDVEALKKAQKMAVATNKVFAFCIGKGTYETKTIHDWNTVDLKLTKTRAEAPENIISIVDDEAYQSLLDNIKNVYSDEEWAEDATLEDIISKVNGIEAAAEKEKAAAPKRSSSKDADIEALKNIELEDNSEKVFAKIEENAGYSFSVGGILDTYRDTNKGVYVCTADNSLVEFEMTRQQLEESTAVAQRLCAGGNWSNNYYCTHAMVCPKCGKVHIVSLSDISLVPDKERARSYYSTAMKVVSISMKMNAWEAAEGWLVRRTFSQDLSVKFEIGKTPEVNKQITESNRLFFNTKKKYGGERKSDGEWDINTRSMNEGEYRATYCCQTKEEVIDAVKASDLKYSGLAEFWQNMDQGNYSLSYVMAYPSRPIIELFVKCGMYNFTRDLIARPLAELKSSFNFNATNICDILKCSKEEFKICREHDLHIPGFQFLHKLKEVCPSAGWDEYKEIYENRGDGETMIHIARTFGISIKKQLEYLQRVYDHQCITKTNALIEWRDYLHMAAKLNYDLKDKNLKFPTSLKKEHDIATFAYNALKEELEAEEFAKRCKENEHLAFESKSMKMAVILPTCPQDVVREGKTMHHCVATYVGSITDGRCMICFVRKTDDLETPFYTVEVADGWIRQVKGSCNCAPTAEVVKFVQKWADEKKLKWDRRY